MLISRLAVADFSFVNIHEYQFSLPHYCGIGDLSTPASSAPKKVLF